MLLYPSVSLTDMIDLVASFLINLMIFLRFVLNIKRFTSTISIFLFSYNAWDFTSLYIYSLLKLIVPFLCLRCILNIEFLCDLLSIFF